MSTTQTITMMRVLGDVPVLALFKPPRRNAVRVRVLRGAEWVDITSRVKRGTITESNDQAMTTLDIELLNGAGFPSLAPRRADSEINQVDAVYDPLLWPGRQIKVDAASSTDGSTPDEWVLVFHGVLGDDVDSVSRPNTVQLFVRDQAKLLLDDHIVGPITYKNMYGSQIIEQLLIDRFNANGLPVLIPFRVIGDDDHWIEEYTIENLTAWQAIQNIVDQSGRDCRFKLDESDGTFKLTYWLPSLDMNSPDWIITGSEIRTETLRISDAQLRNRVEIAYRDAQGKKQEVVATNNQTPIRLCRIEEGDTELIRDEVAAQTFADRLLAYLQDLHATDELTVPFNPYISLFDIVEAHNPAIRSEPERYSVDGRTLTFSLDNWELSLIASGSVGVTPQRWIDKETRPGVKRPWVPDDSTTNRPMPTPTGVQAVSIPGGISITFDEPDPKRWGETWMYTSTTSPVDMGTAPAVRGKAIPLEAPGEPGTPLYARLVHVDAFGNPSLPGPEVVAIPDGFAETPDTTPPATPTGLLAIPVLRGFVLTWDRHQPPPPLDRYILQVSSRPNGGSWSAWSTVSDEIRSNYYSHEGLEPDHEYRYRLRAISRAQVESDWSSTLVAGHPGKVSLAEDVVDRLARGDLAQDVIDELDGIVALEQDVTEQGQSIAALVVQADEISQTVAQVEDDLSTAQSTIQQNATAISQRVIGKDEDGNPVGGEIRLAMIDGKTYILLSADQTIVGRLRVTEDLIIENDDGSIQLLPDSIRMETEDGATFWSPQGLYFQPIGGEPLSFPRGIRTGIAEHDEFVPLPFQNEPEIILAPFDVPVYRADRSNVNQYLQIMPTAVSPEGFVVHARLLAESGSDLEHTFSAEKYLPTGFAYCYGQNGHSATGGTLYSVERIVNPGQPKTYTTTRSTTSGVTLYIREMMHAHAFAGNFQARNTLAYVVRIRKQGETAWLQEYGPVQRVINANSSLLTERWEASHRLQTVQFSNLPPDTYEVQIEITDKTVKTGEGNNDNTSCALILESWEETSAEYLDVPRPIRVQWLAMEPNSLPSEEDDDDDNSSP